METIDESQKGVKVTQTGNGSCRSCAESAKHSPAAPARGVTAPHLPSPGPCSVLEAPLVPPELPAPPPSPSSAGHRFHTQLQ